MSQEPTEPSNEKPQHVKMLVQTSFTKYSGDKGGVPMFSRVGKQTIAEALCF